VLLSMLSSSTLNVLLRTVKPVRSRAATVQQRTGLSAERTEYRS
jgi:hypothetical protein